MIEFERVSKRYDNSHDALREVSFSIDPEELVFLTGHSGAGKSTLLRLIMLMERPSRGRVTVGGSDLSKFSRRSIPRHRQSIGVVFQNHKLLMDRPVYDNVALPLQIAGFEYRDIDRRVNAALDKVGLLDRVQSMPMSLSGGEQQRVGIARAVVGRPSILLADEPTGNLDPELSAEIMQLFVDFSQVGVTVLIASHDLALISRLRHRIITLNDGRLVSPGVNIDVP
ncbi:cell division ATP-binding protein FtsE [Congregibacter brevis]|uniref:Cell division ATP-binding protein FtsE n=1 Tax=Congregibacter brevis TaxID=3081201 RepID=A0ABZ0IEM0_9GAMM|nr:cell division ATP-binding protein FtsE [Congregibacter sp. IMCC45268]